MTSIRVVALYSADRSNGLNNVVVSPADFVAWRERHRSFEEIGAQRFDSVNLSGTDQPVRVSAALVADSSFDVMGVQPMLGRAFTAEESAPGGARVAILNNRFWRNRFDGRAEAVGRTITIDGRTTTIVGVMPPDDFTPDILLPLILDAASPAYSQRALRVAARLKSDVTIEQARADMDAIGTQLEREQPATHRGWGITIQPYRWEFTRPEAVVVFTLLGLAAFAVLLIGCANVASLVLARWTTRTHEMAIRAALGASRRYLVRQMLVESLIVAAAGGVLGLLLAFTGLQLLLAYFFPSGAPAFLQERTQLDTSVLAFTAAVSVGSMLLFGLVPAIHHATPRRDAFADGERNVGSTTWRVRSVLVAGQVAGGVVLLVTATLFMRTLVNLRSIEPGFDTSNLLLLKVALPEADAIDGTTPFYDRVIGRLASSPGVVAAGAAERVPVEGSRFNPNRTIDLEGQPALSGETRAVDDIAVTAGYLETLGVPLREGRRLAPTDGRVAPLVAVISEATARRYWGQTSPIGTRVRLGDEPSPDAWRTVVGVVGDVRNDDIDMPPPPIVYLPVAQRPAGEMTFLIRTASDPLSYVATARAAVAAEDPDLPVYDIRSMDQLLFFDLQGPALISSMAGVFAGLALALAAIGIYGMVAYGVAQRTRELALRIAVGAQTRDVIRTVLARGLGAVLVGLVIGLAGALGVSRLMAVALYEVSPTDPLTYTIVIVTLLGAALLACVAPAVRVLRLDPLGALRHQ